VSSKPVPPRPHLDVEQLSLVVDGQAGPETLAHTAACPECGARVDHWHRVRDAVAIPPAAAPGDRRDAAIGAALEVFDARTKPAEPAEVVEVVEVAGAGRHRFRRLRPVAAVAAAAAALLLVVGLGVGLAHDNDHHTAATSSRSPVSNPATPSTTGESASASNPSSAGVAGAAAPPSTLGSFPDMAALVPVLRSATAGPVEGASSSYSGTSSTPPGARCRPAASAAAGVAPAAPPELAATLEYAGRPAVAYVYRAPATQVAVVLSEADCRLLAKSSF
jgi:hypothetical protein